MDVAFRRRSGHFTNRSPKLSSSHLQREESDELGSDWGDWGMGWRNSGRSDARLPGGSNPTECLVNAVVGGTGSVQSSLAKEWWDRKRAFFVGVQGSCSVLADCRTDLDPAEHYRDKRQRCMTPCFVIDVRCWNKAQTLCRLAAAALLRVAAIRWHTALAFFNLKGQPYEKSTLRSH